MMKRRPFLSSVLLALVLMVAGCSRTIDDVAKWKAKGNIEKLIKALSDPKVEVRQSAADALGELKAEPAVDALAARYNDAEPTVVLAAVKALAAIGTESTTTPLIAALKLDQAAARETAAVALGMLKAAAAVEPLAEALGDSEEAVQCAAATSLGQIGDEAASKPLVQKLSSGSDALRLACAEALASTGGDVAADGLIGALADSSGAVRKAAVASLVTIGKPSIPYALNALKNDEESIRAGSIAVIQQLQAIPLTGADSIWYALAKVSVDKSGAIDSSVVEKLARMDDKVDTLLEAVAHNVADFREHAFRALETIGEPCTAKAVAAAQSSAGAAWFKTRGKWNGAPSWRIDLWGALTALNPQFKLDRGMAGSMAMQGRPAFTVIVAPDFKPSREYIPLLIALLGDTTMPPPEQPDYDAEGIPVVKQAIDRFRGEANQQMAKAKLDSAGDLATYPLIAAIEDDNELVAGHAAELLGEQKEAGALAPLIKVLGRKIAAGEQLTTSPFYNALQKLDDPAAEPLLLKVRPNPDRAMRVFERKYPGARPISAETKDETGHYSQPVHFRLGYIRDGKVGEMEFTFMKDGSGDWIPTPPLPDRLPAM